MISLTVTLAAEWTYVWLQTGAIIGPALTVTVAGIFYVRGWKDKKNPNIIEFEEEPLSMN